MPDNGAPDSPVFEYAPESDTIIKETKIEYIKPSSRYPVTELRITLAVTFSDFAICQISEIIITIKNRMFNPFEKSWINLKSKIAEIHSTKKVEKKRVRSFLLLLSSTNKAER